MIDEDRAEGMTLYLDSSALLKRYIDEADSHSSTRCSRATKLGSRVQSRGSRSGELGRRLSVTRHDLGLRRLPGRLGTPGGRRDRRAASAGGRPTRRPHGNPQPRRHPLAAIQRAGPLGITLVTADLRRAQAARPWDRRPSASELDHHVLWSPNHSWYSQFFYILTTLRAPAVTPR